MTMMNFTGLRKTSIFLLGVLWFSGLAPISSFTNIVKAAPVAVSFTASFSYTGASTTWTVPTSVTSVSFIVVGAGGGGVRGGKGALLTGTLPVTSGEVLQINVGGRGTSNVFNVTPVVMPTNAFGGGGKAGGTHHDVGGGGGASDIRRGTYGLNDRIIVAGGGGGAGQGGGDAADVGGNGGTTNGGNGIRTQSIDSGTGGPGLGGTATAGGAGGLNGKANCFSSTTTIVAETGTAGIGGNGARDSSGANLYIGSGGGGGYFGGGGGGPGCNYGLAGGGSSYFIGTASSTVSAAASTATNGTVSLTYSLMIEPATLTGAAISGTTTQGQTLTASVEGPGGDPATITEYQWKRSDSSGGTYSNISGATASTYVLTASDVAKYIKVRIAVFNQAGGEANKTSSASAQIAALLIAPTLTGAAISGTTTQGQTLTASVQGPGGDPAITTTYQWSKADSSGGSYSNISGATALTYVLTSSDVAKYIKVLISVSNAAGSNSATSSASAQIAALLIAPTPVPAPTPIPVVKTGPPPSILKTITTPKISFDAAHIFCLAGSFIFIRNGYTEETPKITTQRYFVIQDGKTVDIIESAKSQAVFEKKSSYLNTTLSCMIYAGQEGTTTSTSSLNSKSLSEAKESKKVELKRLDAKYYADGSAAYAKKSKELARIAELKQTEISVAKTSSAILLASAKYQKAFTAASDLWKVELLKATTDRDAARGIAEVTYLDSLEKSGVSIFPRAAAPIVTPTPTPTVTPKPTPTSTPTPTPTTNQQPITQMEKVGTLYLASGSYSLNDATEITLKAIALKINASGAKSILIYGHADVRGDVRKNTVLSQQRATAVAAFLRPLLTSKKISIGWYSSKKPVTGGTSTAALALNRRVEIYTK